MSKIRHRLSKHHQKIYNEAIRVRDELHYRFKGHNIPAKCPYCQVYVQSGLSAHKCSVLMPVAYLQVACAEHDARSTGETLQPSLCEQQNMVETVPDDTGKPCQAASVLDSQPPPSPRGGGGLEMSSSCKVTGEVTQGQKDECGQAQAPAAYSCT